MASEIDRRHVVMPREPFESRDTGARAMTARDQEPLDDVTDWANAVVALLEDVPG
jgi:hypothetical protein